GRPGDRAGRVEAGWPGGPPSASTAIPSPDGRFPGCGEPARISGADALQCRLMSPFTVDPEVLRRIRDFRLPETLGFGQCLGPVLFCARYRDGRWEHGRLLPYGPLPVDPAAKVLHFGQVVFEGLKAYRVNQDVPALFRPDMNQARFNASARRMALPEMPPELFHEGLLAVTGY